MEEHTVTHRVEGLDGVAQRLDAFIAERLKLLPRSQLKLRLKSLRVNGREVKPSRKVREGDEIEIVYTDPPPLSLEPEPMPLDVIYEDSDVIVINKPRGLVVHPGAGHRRPTLVGGLLAHCAGLSAAFPGFPLRPGIVHRLDKETSGVIIAAKHPAALEYLARQFRLRRAKKLYVALVSGKFRERAGRIETLIARDRRHRQRFVARPLSDEAFARGKRAVTDYRVLKEWERTSLVALKPRTGRTHQLRVHCRHLGCPILGDPLYGPAAARGEERLLLHAYKLKVRLPASGRPRVFTAPLPEDFKRRLRRSGPGGTAR